MHGHPLYQTWTGMLHRCYSEDSKNYPNYGGRGIEVCERWHDVRLFVEDIERELGPRPEGCTLNRKDNDGNYELGNVEWATRGQQARNTRRGAKSVRKKRDGGGWSYRINFETGCFDSEEEAQVARLQAIEKLRELGLIS